MHVQGSARTVDDAVEAVHQIRRWATELPKPVAELACRHLAVGIDGGISGRFDAGQLGFRRALEHGGEARDLGLGELVLGGKGELGSRLLSAGLRQERG